MVSSKTGAAYKYTRTMGSKFVTLTFCKYKKDVAVHVKMDKQAALVYMVKMGRGRNLLMTQDEKGKTRTFFSPSEQTCRLRLQIPKYISWQPDPHAWMIDAFKISWTHLAYAFPYFALIGRALAKAMTDKCTLIIITLVWPSQQWYS